MKSRLSQFCPPRRRGLCHAAVTVGLCLVAGPAHHAVAQATGPGGAAPGGTGASGPGTSAPGANAPAPGVSGGVPAPPPGRPLTLADVVNRAVGSNSGLVLAQQRLQKAQELINQVNAQGRPQFSANANDTYASYRAFPPTLTSPTVTNPALPGGGQIPVVVDQAAGLSTAFIGGGGGGNAPSTGATLSTPGLSGTPTSGAGSTPGIGQVSPAGPSTPSVGGTNPTVGGPAPTVTAPTPGTTAPPAPNPGGAGPASPAPGGGTAPGTPGTTTPGTATPGAGGTPAPGTGTGGAGTGGATGLALLSVPAIVAAYVADMRTLTQPLSPTVTAPQVTVSHAAKPQEEAQPRQPGDAGGGGNAGSGSTGASSSVGGGAVGQRNTAAARVNVTQFVDLFGLLPAARDAQKDVRDFYALDIARLQNETALAAKNLFFNVLLAQAQVATQQEQVNYANENVRITQARLRQGIVSRFDVLTAQTALATAQQQLIAAQDLLDLANSNLSYLLGADPDRPLTLQTPPLPPLDQAVDLTQSTRIALRQRPELGQANSNIKEAQRLIKLAGSTLLPTLGIVGSGEYNSIASTLTPQSFATLSAQLAVPLDDGGATRSRVRSAQVDLATQTLTQEQLQLTVALEVRQASINVRNAQAQVGAATAGVTQAQEALRLAYVRYQGGLGTFLDVLNALAQLAATRTNLANAGFFYQTSLAQLVRALGGR
ncbi:MAG: TolC family protein [Armatimonadetes bacterium]|nr:TolC family protein [Armatimonadota bacterium]